MLGYRNWFSIILILFGIILLCINFYGLTESIRPDLAALLDKKHLRFESDGVVSYQETINKIHNLKELSSKDDIASHANKITNTGLEHIQWKRVDPKVYRLRIPIWENYILFLLSVFTNVDQFERYHFANYSKNLERGVGICGDASTILSSILDKHQIRNEIISFDGHVIVQYENDNNEKKLLDPDFGVLMNFDVNELYERPSNIRNIYSESGYSDKEIQTLERVYKRGFLIFDDTFHFMTKRYLFEVFSYILKWTLPFIFLIFGYLLFSKNTKKLVVDFISRKALRRV
jgi:hypothetical protein